MSSATRTEYCAFTKAVEHLGDRWSLLIVRELATRGGQGFNALASGLPGRISRSVLVDKLRKLEDIGLVGRDPSAPSRSAPYRLTPAGEQLVPTLMSLWQWAEKWVPEDPAMVQRDPTIMLWWLRHRVSVTAIPERQVVIEIAMRGSDAEKRYWLLMARNAEPQLCLEDPLLTAERYVYVEADAADLYEIARGLRPWTDAIGDRAVRVYGEPDLVAALPHWFSPNAGTEEHLAHRAGGALERRAAHRPSDVLRPQLRQHRRTAGRGRLSDICSDCAAQVAHRH